MKLPIKETIKNVQNYVMNIKNKKAVVLATSSVAIILAAVITITSIMNSKGVITKNGDLMKGVGGARVKNARVTEGFSETYANFCLDLLINSNKQDNIAFAPSNVMSAVGLLGYGAESNTRLEIERTLGMKSKEIGEQISSIESRIKFNEKKGYGLRFSNNILMNNTVMYGIKKRFLKDNAKYFGLGLDRVSFSDEKEVTSVFEKYTEEIQYISKVNYDVDKLQYMNILSNAAFNAKWDEEVCFKDTENDIFTGSNFTTETTLFNFLCDSFIEGGVYKGFTKKLKGDFTFVGLLPDEQDVGTYYTVDMIFTELAETGQFKNITSTAREEEVAVSLPLYNNNVTATTTTKFSSIIKNMGIHSVFEKTANFDNMAEMSANLHVSEIAAAGNIALCPAGVCDAQSSNDESNEKKIKECDNKLIFNREFAYLIIDDKTGLPIYCAIVRTLA